MDLELIALDLVTLDVGRCVPTDSGATVESGSDCGPNAFCNARLTVEGIGGDGNHAPKAHKADDEDGTMHFADDDDDLGWKRCYERCLGRVLELKQC